MYYQKITVTPAIANELLQSNKRNRPIRPRRVSAIASDMIAGKWSETPQPIAFNKDGKLIDGQHRIAAVIKANIPIDMWACYGVDDNVVIDRGSPRSTGDSLYMRGIVDDKLAKAETVAIVRRYNAIANGSQFMTDDMIADFINDNADNLSKTIQYTHLRGCSTCRKTGIQVAVLSALMNGVSEDVIRMFTYVANTGFMNNENQSAAIVLRNFVAENDVRGWSGANRLAAVAQMAIRDFAEGTPRTAKYRDKRHVYIKPDEVIR